ncbi:MAG: tail fiber domain-containing protein [Paludibacteraceae bacterium]|nr:tail fiber domain-containing protein [Paludibacteraceae bacterium]
MAGETITFTKLALGNGQSPANIKQLTALVNNMADMQITSIEIGDGCAELEGSFDNGTLNNSFYATEFGVFAEDPDAGEILYAYANAGDDATLIPAYSTNSFELTTFKLVVVVGDAEHVTAVIGEYSGYTTKEEFDAHVHDTDNPHGVTKEHVGLGEVPNVSTNNQTPTFAPLTPAQIEDATQIPLENIANGDTLGVMLGKIRNVISRVFHHFNATNPHNITTTTIGAAANVHKHTASDITSLSSFLTSLINGQHIILSNTKYLYGKDSKGGSHRLAGIGGDGQVWFGTEPGDNVNGQYTHLHSAGPICIRTYNPNGKEYRYLCGDTNGNWYPSGGTNRQTFGKSGNRWSTVYCQHLNESSDAKKKDVIGDIEKAEELIRGLRPIGYNWKDDEDGRYQMGFSAQEVFELMQSLGIKGAGLYQAGRAVTLDHDSLEVGEENLSDEQIRESDDRDLDWGLDYSQFIAPLVAVVQSQDARIKELENIIKAKED